MAAISVDLTEAELEKAARVACMRQIENLFKQRQDAYGASRDDGWTKHIEGAAAEMAVAKWSGLDWTGNLGDLGADDVGTLQVRSTHRHDGRLIIHRPDRDDRQFVLVTGLAPSFVLRGWLWGRDGKRKEWWLDPSRGRPAFFVPQSALRSMWEIAF